MSHLTRGAGPDTLIYLYFRERQDPDNPKKQTTRDDRVQGGDKAIPEIPTPQSPMLQGHTFETQRNLARLGACKSNRSRKPCKT